MDMLSVEQRYTDILRGGTDNSPLTTDGYKFSMAQAGFPLRHEHFYLHFRKGPALFIPFDFRKVIGHLRPRHPNSREQGFLLANGYGMTPAMEAALDGSLHIYAQPKGSWANGQEPVVVPSGPSFLASWYEDFTIAFNFPMQVATALLDGVTTFKATCEDEGEIIELVAEAMTLPKPAIEVCEAEYRSGLRLRLAKMRDALGGDIDRAFEVGMRSMTCMAQHRIVLEECKRAGITRTSNVKLAYDLYMTPVGTTGHEHQERHGADINGFRAIRDTRPEPPSYLFDTYDPINLGIPAAIEVLLEDRVRRASVRFDSGDQPKQLGLFRTAQLDHMLNLFYLFMDGYDDVRTASMETLCKSLGIPPMDRHYGPGGYIVIDESINPYSRNKVAMVYKLCQSGGPGYDGVKGCRNTQKYSGSPGKESIAGRPIVVMGWDDTRYICQEGEGFTPPGGVLRSIAKAPRPDRPSVLSPGTVEIREACRARDLNGEGK